MATQANPEPTRDGPRPWLMPALIGGLVTLAAIIAVVLTIRPAPVQVPTTTQAVTPITEAHTTAGAATAEAGVTHGGLNPTGPAVEQIGLATAKARFDAGTAIFIDVRAGSEYTSGHIPGALTITTNELESKLKSLPDGAVIIAYGSTERPDSGQRGAQIFMELGYPKVIALEGGFQAWRDAGHPVEP
ncbi:MAG: rhodanese-like domain-containing protein [Chloroflexales bacterium]